MTWRDVNGSVFSLPTPPASNAKSVTFSPSWRSTRGSSARRRLLMFVLVGRRAALMSAAMSTEQRLAESERLREKLLAAHEELATYIEALRQEIADQEGDDSDDTQAER